MIIRTLVENTSSSENMGHEHGLSLYIETKTHKLLFDTGASALFIENAKLMNIDLSAVDIVVISHGHYDHGGGLKSFLQINSHAKIYLKKKAFEKHYSNRSNGEKVYIGLDQSLLPNDRFQLVGDHLTIDEELELFSAVKMNSLKSSCNRDLYMAVGKYIVPDNFAHEQNLIIKENENSVLIAGCAHNGIVNILEHYHKGKNNYPSHVIGGFHLCNPSANTSEDPTVVTEIGEYLLETRADFYTCHCTGIESYNRLKSIPGIKMNYVSTGSQIVI